MTDERLKPGNCHKCGLPMSDNPHPEAGKPGHYLDVGCRHECIPCLVHSRHQWAGRAMKAENEVRDLQAARATAEQSELTVWSGSMPESNGKSNFTAILHRGDLSKGHTIDRSEYPDRVRYEADRVRWLIGEVDKEPWILDYDADKHSGYVAPIRALKSQQDAAIESKPTYEDGYRDAWSEACPNCGHVKGEQLDSGEAK